MEKRKYFGTDGIRGKANVFPMTLPMTRENVMSMNTAGSAVGVRCTKK